ncbi:Aste57867_16272 [Aphanomyces stellatus]|uniref:Aste57867_16272 protein n=1 Tax=Aphanomyces stellatus TaxID=120398 RepID=A0A485L6Y7_9STRA|nr:hypothetical protein As57867_016215 [Aphanomyces stellatus]VFT93048.1 Aste57867_16272 [Aphanomyces stellatus]
MTSSSMRPIDTFLVDLCGSSLGTCRCMAVMMKQPHVPVAMSVGGVNAATLSTLVRTIRFPNQLDRLFTEFIGVVDDAQQVEVSPLDMYMYSVRLILTHIERTPGCVGLHGTNYFVPHAPIFTTLYVPQVKHEASNAHACIDVGFHRSIVKFIETHGLWPGFSRSLLKKILALLMHIAQYSVTADDIRAMLQVFQCERMKVDAPEESAVTTYLASLEMMARSVTGPSTYLELSGDQSGFTVPSMETVPFPSAGDTLSVWIRVESAPGLNAPLFSLCGDTGVGIEMSFMETTLVVKSLDWKKNEYNEVQVPGALVKHQWQWICVVHTHRQIRGSKLDVFVNGDIRQSSRFSYPNMKEAGGAQPKMLCHLGRTKNDYSRCLVAHLGPVAFFSQPLQANVLESIKSVDDYDNVVLQYNASVASSHVTATLSLPGSSSTVSVSTPSSTASSGGTDGLVFAFDARNYDSKRKTLLDASGTSNHAENHSTNDASIRLRTTATFKESVWQMGGPIILFPLLLHPPTQADFLDLTSCQTISRPLGVTCIPKVINVLAETLRHSSINKFVCRRSQAIPMVSLLIDSLPTEYLTADLLASIERLCSAVSSDRFISDEIQRHLLYNFRLWVPAPVEIQNSIFDKLHVAIKKKFVSSSVVSIRYMLRLLSTVYRKPIAHHNTDDTTQLRNRILETIRILLYDPEAWAKAQAKPKSQLSSIIMGGLSTVQTMGVSFDAARTLIFCMLGKPTFPQGIIDDTSKGAVASEVEVDAGAMAEHVAESDIPDLMQILVDFSITSETQSEFLSIFERLGGLRIWLPLISTHNAPVRRMTLRLLRTYIIIKCNSFPNANPKPSLSAVDVRMIFDSLKVVDFPLQMGSFNELFCLLLGVAYGDPAVDPFVKGSPHDHAAMLSDETLLAGVIRHPNMVLPLLEIIGQSALHFRWIGLSYLKLLMSDENVDGATNRRIYLQAYAAQGYTPYPIEVMFNSFVADAASASPDLMSQAFPTVSTAGLHDMPILQLRDVISNVDQTDEARLSAAMSLTLLGDPQSLLELLHQDALRCEQLRKHKHAKDKSLSEYVKTGIVYLLSTNNPSSVQQFLSASAMDLLAQIVVLELKTNDVAYELVLHPFALASNPDLVMSWLKTLVDRIAAMVETQMPPKGSLCWRNLESICSIATSVVLHFDPPPPAASLRRDSIDTTTAFWKTPDELPHERELSDAILHVWQKCAASLSFDVDASFGRTAQSRASLTSQAPSTVRSTSNALAKRGSFKDAPTSSSSSGTPSLRQFPGGAMRQILGLVLRSMYMSVKDQEAFFRGDLDYDEDDEDDEAERGPPQRRRSRLNSSVAMDTVFVSKLTKLDYFVQMLKLNQYITAKEEASLTLWLVLEITHLMEDAQRLSQTEPRWMEGTRRCAELITRIIQVPIGSMDQLKAMLQREDFMLTDSEVTRRDLFYQEYLETSQEVRQKKKTLVLAVVDYERDSAKQAVDIVLASGIQVRPEHDPIWLQRVHAKDADDWMKLERVLRWNIQHVWSFHTSSNKTANWQLDAFTSSKWMRCRLLPDVEKEQPYTKKTKAPVSINSIYGDAALVQETTLTPPLPSDDEVDDENAHDGDEEAEESRVLGSLNDEEETTEQTITVEVVETNVPSVVVDRLRGDSILGVAPTLPPPPAVVAAEAAVAAAPTPALAVPAEPEPAKRASMSSRFVTGLRLPMFGAKKPVDKPVDKTDAKPQPSVEDEPEKIVADPNTTTNASSSPAIDEKTEPKKRLVLSGSFRTMAYIVLPEGRMVYGMFRLGATSLVFEGEKIADEQDIAPEKSVVLLKRRIFGMRIIKAIYRRRFRLDMSCGMEVYFVDGSSLLLGFDKSDDVETAFAIFRQRKPPCLTTTKRLLTGDRLVVNSNWQATAKWVRREITTFEYLMLLNIAAGRSYNDITQYPIFPWILRDYTSETLDLEDPDIFRDFTKPIGAQTSQGVEAATQHYQSMGKFPFHFAAPYSSQQTVLSCLLRMAPFSQSSKALGNNTSSLRPLQSISQLWDACTSSKPDALGWELLPEFFVTSEFLLSQDVGDVALPPWAMGSVDTFIRLHRQALESDFVSSQLHHWIDLVFGVHQRGPLAVERTNVFHPVCYPDGLNLALLDVDTRTQYSERGTIPLQLFKKSHPHRLTVDESLETRYPASHALASLSSRSQVRRYDVPSRHEIALLSVRFSSATATGMGMGAMTKSVKSNLVNSAPVSEVAGSIVYSCDATGLVLAKRYQNATPDTSKGAPFTLQEVEQWWRLPAMCSIVDGMVYYEHMISCGYFDGSWRIHWSADGELLQRIAFHKQRILCMARSEDDVTGDVALAFGSEDCTISVWAISKFAASRSRRMFLSTAKKELPVGNLPWVLLVGHSRPVVSVAINVELDVVASTCRGHTLLLHSLRTSCPLHAMDLSVPDIRSMSIYLTISNQGAILSHALHDVGDETTDNNWRAAATQSELSLISINGRVMSRVRLEQDGRKISLLQRGVTFTRCGEHVVTANASREGGIEVRKIGDLNTCARRIETNRSSVLTCFGLSQDERCVVAGYEDGSLVMYALHYGISDEGRLLSDKRARAEEAAAFARATNPSPQNDVEVTSLSVPQGLDIDASLLTTLNDAFTKLKRPCVADDPDYEQLLRSFWAIMYPPVDILNEDGHFERVGTSWSRLGFQRPDPTTDFRAGGLLSLHCLISFATKYGADAKRMTESQIPGSHEHTYPWGPVAINITCMTAALLWNKADGQLRADKANLWPVFAHPDAFYIMFSEAFLLFDCAWCGMNAQYSSFSVVMELTTKEVVTVMKDNHGSLNEFQRAMKARSAALKASFDDELIASTTIKPMSAPAALGGGTTDNHNLISFSPPETPPSNPTPLHNSFNLLQLSPPKPHSSHTLDPFAAMPDPFVASHPDPFSFAAQPVISHHDPFSPAPVPAVAMDPFAAASLDPFSPRNMHRIGPADYTTSDPFDGL